MSSPSTNTLGKYQIIREIGRSNDIVYEAVDPTINRRVALKELSIAGNIQGAQRRERIERFRREGKAAGRLSHPNIVTVFEVGQDNDRYFIAMEFLEGQTLRDVLQSGGPLSMNAATDYMLQLCSALSYAHANGVIHRDVKPENVQVVPGNHVKLTDFGIARLMDEPSITQDGQVFGTPSYMSPEQVAGKNLDARSDIFSLGVLFYEMIAGAKPFAGDSVVTITYNIMHMEAPPPPNAPPYVVGIIRKAMAKDPDMRYSSVDEMAQDIVDQKSSDGFVQDQTGAFGSPFPGAPQQPSGPLSPYGTPMPSSHAGSVPGAAPDPFAPGAPPPAPMAAPAPPRPIMSAETRNFLGVLLLAIGFAGMLVFAIWAVNLAYESYITAQTSGAAERYYEQGERAYSSGNVDAAMQQWRNAIRVSPDSSAAQSARERLFEVSVELAWQYYQERNSSDLADVAEGLVEAGPKRPEGHFYLGAAFHLDGKLDDAKREYALAVEYGGNDSYAQNARQSLAGIYITEGDAYVASGRISEAIESYQKAKQYADAELLPAIQSRINQLR